jgi:sugar O-acyltransferase (sialic acid O-acetyltransferase NeuD family)
MKTFRILGNAFNYVPVIFDVILDIEQKGIFEIYPNVDSGEPPKILFAAHNYSYNIIQPEAYEGISGNEFTFGVNGPNAKFTVLNYFQRYGITRNMYVNWLHPKAYVSRSVHLDQGIFVEPNATISSHANIGFGVTIKRNTSIGHHSIIGDFSEINPGVTILSNVVIGQHVIIGGGSTIRDGISVGNNVMIGMGSNVTKSIPDNVIAFGNPCKVWKVK